MKAPFIFGTASLALHILGGAWLLDARAPGEGSTSETASLSVAASAAAVEALAAWERQPELSLNETSLAQPKTDAQPAPATPEAVPARAELTGLAEPLEAPDAPKRQDAILPLAAAPTVLQLTPDTPPTVDGPERPSAAALDSPLITAPKPVATEPPPPPATELAAITPPPNRPDRRIATESSVKPSVAAPESSASSPRTAKASPAEDPGLRAHWASSIRSRLARHHRVPKAALRAGIEGRVVLRLTVRPDGAVSGLAIRQGSGHAILDEAALASVRRAGRLPAAPTGVTTPMTFDVPLTFRIG